MNRAMPLLLTADADEFASRAEGFLSERVERNVLATVLHAVRTRGGFGAGDSLFAALVDDTSGEPIAVALRTPPWPLLATGFEDSASAGALMAAWLDRDPEPPGVSGEPGTARALAAAYTTLTGGTSGLEIDEAMHTLTEVTGPPRPAPGSLRRAADQDRPTLVEWEREFIAEAGMGDTGYAEASVERRFAAGYQYVWVTDDGALVSTVAHNRTIAGTARIGPVYTPKAHRRHGYASSAVAAVSLMLLDGGARQCMLFTDLANPTSNKIYAAVGYRRFGDWEQLRFHPPLTR
jgi:predicted GNAT family acetyltransferase